MKDFENRPIQECSTIPTKSDTGKSVCMSHCMKFTNTNEFLGNSDVDTNYRHHDCCMMKTVCYASVTFGLLSLRTVYFVPFHLLFHCPCPQRALGEFPEKELQLQHMEVQGQGVLEKTSEEGQVYILRDMKRLRESWLALYNMSLNLHRYLKT